MNFRDHRDQKRRDSRFAAVQELKQAGWRETVQGIWKCPHNRFAYPVKQAIEMNRRREHNLLELKQSNRKEE